MDKVFPLSSNVALNSADLALAVVLGLGLVVGLAQGLIRQALALVALYVALVLAAQYHPYLGRSLEGWVAGGPGVRNVVALAVLFVAFAVILNWLTRYIYCRQTSLAALVWGDRFGGAALGLIWAWTLGGLALTIANVAVSFSWQGWEADRLALSNALSHSSLAPLVNSYLPFLFASLRPWLPQGLPAVFT